LNATLCIIHIHHTSLGHSSCREIHQARIAPPLQETSSLPFGTSLAYYPCHNAVSCRLTLHGALTVVKANGHKLLQDSRPGVPCVCPSISPQSSTGLSRCEIILNTNYSVPLTNLLNVGGSWFQPVICYWKQHLTMSFLSVCFSE